MWRRVRLRKVSSLLLEEGPKIYKEFSQEKRCPTEVACHQKMQFTRKIID
jgi:hypothetical protein